MTKTTYSHKIISPGTIFGKLTVLKENGRNRGGRVYQCRCVCGTVVNKDASNLRSGRTKSCKQCLFLSLSKPTRAYEYAYGDYKKGAQSRGFSFDLSFEQFSELAAKTCYYCGAPPRITCFSLGAAIAVPMNGVDRVDSSIGYLLNNCVPCCSMCNRAKSLHPVEDFIAWARRIAAYADIREECDAAKNG